MPNTAHRCLFFLLATCTLLCSPHVVHGPSPALFVMPPATLLDPTQPASHALSHSRSCVPAAPELYEPHYEPTGLNRHIHPLLRPIQHPQALPHLHWAPQVPL
ncbi:hypothetical protein BD779DRAFT_1520476 [Infundibulicybe gibba]|nr:hypothetical protein BD779DRAFT_1520476 [Infundibulicybe gibba]